MHLKLRSIKIIHGLFGSGNGHAGGTPVVIQTTPSLVFDGIMFSGQSQRPTLEHLAPGQTASHCCSWTQPLSPGLTSSILARIFTKIFYTISVFWKM